MFEFVVGAINKILSFFRDIILYVINLLPDSPFRTITFPVQLKTLFAYLNYFIPIKDMLEFTAVWCAAVLVWYAVRWILRVVRYIQ